MDKLFQQASDSLKEKFKELEAERDRLKGELEYQKTIEEQMDVINEGLRSRHAALVEVLRLTKTEIDLKVSGMKVTYERLKAALAEVKG